MISRSILIVDDEKDLMSTLVRRLTKRGIRAEGVSTGRAAISWLSEKRADVVVLDIILPDMKGLDLMMAIKEAGHDPIIIILTGHASVDLAKNALENGASEYIIKPCPAEELLGRIAHSLRRNDNQTV